MSEIKKVKVSELAELTDPKGYWMFGYKTENNKHVSKRVSWNRLVKVVEDAAKSIQLQRRIIVVFERPQQLIPMGEGMTIEKIVARNITKLEYKENKIGAEWIEIPLDTSLSNLRWNGGHDIVLQINGTQQNVSIGDYEKYSTITIFAKADE